MKRKNLTILLCVLTFISLISVGFAAWVISDGDTAEMSGNIQVETVTDERLEIVNLKFDNYVYGSEVTDNNKMPEFVFGTPEGADNSGWLTNSTIGVEKLTIKVTFEVRYIGTEELLDDSDVAASVDFNILINEVLTSSVSAGDDKYYASVKNPQVSCDNGKFSCDLTLEWGNYFNGTAGVNPYEYYNGQIGEGENATPIKPSTIISGTTTTYADDAKTRLTAMYEALKVAQYKVVVTVEKN